MSQNGLYGFNKIVDFLEIILAVISDEEINAAIMGIPRYEVTVAMKDGMPGRMKCQCPKYRSGRSCEHIAAALYSVFGGILKFFDF